MLSVCLKKPSAKSVNYFLAFLKDADFLQAFFEIDYSKAKEDVKEKREYNLKVFKLTTEILKGQETMNWILS